MKLLMILNFVLLVSCTQKEYPKYMDVYFLGERPGVVTVRDQATIQEIMDILKDGQKTPPSFKMAVKIWIDIPPTKLRDYAISRNHYRTAEYLYEVPIDLEEYLREKVLIPSKKLESIESQNPNGTTTTELGR
ncbi:MAG: hypothetical protein AAF554_03635 [Bacteroidota bacterium]